MDPKEDTEVRRQYGRSAKRQQQILRMTVEAQDQKALLTQEDLAEILGTDVRTIRRDIQYLRKKVCVFPAEVSKKILAPESPTGSRLSPFSWRRKNR